MWQRKDNETDEALIYRICSHKDEIGNWQDVADVLNDILGVFYSESKYRKQYHRMLLQEDEDIEQQEQQTENHEIKEDDKYFIELKKEKQKLSDLRVELNRVIREEARKESYADMIKKIVATNVPQIDLQPIADKNIFSNHNDLIVHLTDIHTGIEIDNFKNQFNKEILKQRLQHYAEQIITIQNTHKSENCYIIIGEVLSGIIHNELRIQNNMDMMQQFKYVCELITQMILTLRSHFDNIYVYVTEGNHSRISPKKEDSLKGENMDILVPFYLQARFMQAEDVHIYENPDPIEIARFHVRGHLVMAAHGDRDTVENVVQNWTMMFGEKPDLVYLGHRHTNAMKTVYDTKVIQSGCVSGSDDYAVNIRKVNNAEQTVSVITNDGLLCVYDITL